MPARRPTLNVFALRERLVREYADYLRSFLEIRDADVQRMVAESLQAGHLWPEPLIQMNPSFEPGGTVDELVERGLLHPECARIFRKGKKPGSSGSTLQLHRHQLEAVEAAAAGEPYVLTTGTGSGKSLSYIVPIVDRVLKHGSGRGIQALVLYPMNALANSQEKELRKFVCEGYAEGRQPVSFAIYTGQEDDRRRQEILANPPDILLTNYMMMELLLTRPGEEKLIRAARDLQFLVLDELHTYRGRQGADVALLVRRIRDRCGVPEMLCVGTSATLAGDGEGQDPKALVARFASRLFGQHVSSRRVIGETLRRVTATKVVNEALKRRLQEGPAADVGTCAGFMRDPLSVWMEGAFGVTEVAGRLVRCTPQRIGTAAARLAEETCCEEDLCRGELEQQLLRAYELDDLPEGEPIPYAFRFHQFFSRGDTVYASLDAENRHVTLSGQTYVPGDRSRILLPLAFCRECGQDYYLVRIASDGSVAPREIGERGDGGAFLAPADAWPEDSAEQLPLLPEDWLDGERLRRDASGLVPRRVRLGTDGIPADDGIPLWSFPASFRFCLRCGATYSSRTQTDLGKLTTLDMGGRSTATTILSLSALRAIHEEGGLEAEARKILSFTDNRQDASLQAGHFNDFLEVGLVRSALVRAMERSGGLRHEELAERVFQALDLPLDVFAIDPNVRYHALEETRRALREVLAYRLYRDLRGGWRVTSPNLEQCGLLVMGYSSLQDLCRDPEPWAGAHNALREAGPEARELAARTLLDLTRRELAIRVDYLEPTFQDRMRQLSSQHLCPPWALDEEERLEQATLAVPGSRSGRERPGTLYLSGLSGLGQFLRRPSTLGQGRLSVDDAQTVIRDLLRALAFAGLVLQVEQTSEGLPGYRLQASALQWRAGDGSTPARDPLRMPRMPEGGGRTNPFFVKCYRSIARDTQRYRAHEHTAQVSYELRREREERFAEGRLPLLFCSPTMELGVDIKQLNVVNLRNVPPTPANYAQRSGRAGRSGQPALVFTYCATGSGHDQYFYRRPERMVSGQVSLPRLDLANEDLLTAHLHAVWLAETGASLGSSLKDVLDVGGDPPQLNLQPGLVADLSQATARDRAQQRIARILESLRPELAGARWFTADWAERVLRGAGEAFDRACDRWRDLYRAAHRQMQEQHRIMADASRPEREKRKAEREHREAYAQLRLLLADAQAVQYSDFYTYRYFASEGFLPGYNFPRLPLSAFIPGRRLRDEFLSRPRFLAISEFGPRSILYHEGSKYRITKVILPPDREVLTRDAKICEGCGYLHPIEAGEGPDRCERCAALLPTPMRRMLPMQNVATRRQERIHSDEEERVRQGYELLTTLRLPTRDGRVSCLTGTLGAGEAELVYAQAATLWRVNLGWSRRRDRNRRGFLLDVERGYWSRNAEDPSDSEDPTGPRVEWTIPYVEDRRNALLLTPEPGLEPRVLLTLLWALKSALQVRYQVEENELAVELLPTPESPATLLFYEAAEGGAGVLQRLVEEPEALARTCAEALALCHFDVQGEDLGSAPGATERCETACYDCLLTYGNQRYHRTLDRASVRELLLAWSALPVRAAAGPRTRTEQVQDLSARCASELERQWLRFLDEGGYHLPDEAQVFLEECGTRPDFLYTRGDYPVAVYVDGPHHLYPHRAERDRNQTSCLRELGYTVLRFALPQMDRAAEGGGVLDWPALVEKYPAVFGTGRRRVAGGDGPDLDLFEPDWYDVVQRLAATPGVLVDSGGDVGRDGRVVGTYWAEVRQNGRRVRLVDGRDPACEEVRAALQAEGVPALILVPEDYEALRTWLGA